ncbi:hypothetical protein F5144DRAFT_132902 [Chaetomium tenue]|uniref:Uncharacterized protein n=1 Tax=Chaetomium tenue TaxID=1854479 RepID=A0ACB7PHI5_9PEZI|nr:hypothetical protein F5144DRAFT_132902 [Chaetomium globosum]
MRRNAGSQKWTRENRCIDQSRVQTLQKTPDPLAILHRRKGCEQGTSILQDVHGSLSGLAHLRWADKPNGCGAKKVFRWCFHIPGLGSAHSSSGTTSSLAPPLSGGRSVRCPAMSHARLGAMLGPAPKGTLDTRLELGSTAGQRSIMADTAEVEVDLESSRR